MLDKKPLTTVITTDKANIDVKPDSTHADHTTSHLHQWPQEKNTARVESIIDPIHHAKAQDETTANPSISKSVSTANPSINMPASTASNPSKNMPTSIANPPKKKLFSTANPRKNMPASTTKSKAFVSFKSNKVINQVLLDFLGPYEAKRAPQRVVLIPNPKSKSRQRWLAYHPNNPEVKFKPKGYYAYATKLDEINLAHPEGKQIVAWSIKGHNDTFHIGLSGFSETLGYAGEVLFSTQNPGHLEHFDSASGTYNPDEKHKKQAGFPVEKFRKPDFPF